MRWIEDGAEYPKMTESFSDKVCSLGRVLAGTVILVLGLAGCLFLAINLARDASLWLLGRHTAAQVIDSRIEMTTAADPEDVVVHCYIEYQFATPAGQVFERSTRVAPNELVEVGGSVAVVYFPLYPAHNRLDESRYVPLLACAYLPLMLVSFAVLSVGWHMVGSGTRLAELTPLRIVTRRQNRSP
jgi:hypothetical protein